MSENPYSTPSTDNRCPSCSSKVWLVFALIFLITVAILVCMTVFQIVLSAAALKRLNAESLRTTALSHAYVFTAGLLISCMASQVARQLSRIRRR